MNMEQTYEEQASQLLKAHGKLVKVLCQADKSITFVYQDGHTWTDSVFMKFGYYGQGAHCFKRFLYISGFDVSSEEIAELEAPVTLVAGQPPPRAIVIEAPTVEEARQKANESVPSGAKVLGFQVINDGAPEAKEVEDTSREAALEKAKRYIPEGGTVQEEQVVREGKEGILTVQAYSEQDARNAIEPQLPVGANIQNTVCTRGVSKGFLGFGRKPGTYEVSWILPWKIRLIYRRLAAVKVRFQPSSK